MCNVQYAQATVARHVHRPVESHGIYSLTNVDLCWCAGADVDLAERPSLSGDGDHRQGNGEEVRQVLQEDAQPLFTERSRKEVRPLPCFLTTC